MTHGSSEGRKVSHCCRSQCCYGEPTGTARIVQFEVVAVAVQPRFHHIQHLNEVIVGSDEVASVQNGWSLSKCVLLLQQTVCIFSYDEGI